MCFNIFHVFNVKYPIESNDFWLLIQTFFITKYVELNVIIKQISVKF